MLGCAAELGFAQVGYRGVTHEVFWIYSTCPRRGWRRAAPPGIRAGHKPERAAHAKGFVVWMRQHSQQSSGVTFNVRSTCTIFVVKWGKVNSKYTLAALFLGAAVFNE